MTPEQFDPSLIIRELAAGEWPCATCNGTGNVEERAYPPGQAVTTCSDCGSTGYIVPFASLRVKWQHGHTHQACIREGLCLLTVMSYLDIVDCDGRGWVPQPSVREACWETAVVLEQQDWDVWWGYDYTDHTWRWVDGSDRGVKAESAEEACLRGAKAWFREESYNRSTERLP